MKLQFYNSLGRQVAAFQPIQAGKVRLYTCGPTVYDYAQLGNLRTFVFYDTLRRTLEANEYQVQQVMNITDVGHLTSDADEGEDKLEKGAKSQGKSVGEVAEFYTKAFMEDVQALNILEPRYAKATDFIAEQIEIIKLLVAKDFAYQTEQAIYFDVTKLPSYGQLTGQKLEDKEVAVRDEVVTDKNKRHPQDFALWFFTVGHFAEHSLRWPSPWGEGFPGWHLECSAIIHATLGDPLDIHAAGVDLIGTHNTNEMAQTEAAFGHQLANYWLHSEHLLIDGQRMGKSLGNFYSLADVVKRGYDPLSLRLLYLQAHYRTQLNFTWESLGGAQQNLNDLGAWADLKHQPGALKAASQEEISKFNAEIDESLANDFNTARALAAINGLIDKVRPAANLLAKIDELLGLKLSRRLDINDQQKKLISERQAARQAKDWAKADELRQKIESQGLSVRDTDSGPLWSRL